MSYKVYIAGAGSGNIGNLTVRVKEIIEKSDVILYDNLVSDEVLNLSKKNALLVDVGKISGHHKVIQENTNSMIVEYAKKYNTVLRLKGGDPFVFGRGAEEAEELLKENIDFEILSAVTSVTSVPASFGIPVTHRDFASSFFVITGKKKGNLPLDEEDFKKFATLKNTTMIFMMSVSSAKYIAQNLIMYGMDKNTSATIISNGTMANEKKYEYTLETLSKINDTSIFETPGMLVVGDVVKLSDTLYVNKNKKLYGKRIIINVPRQKSDRLEKLLYENGAQVVNISTNYLDKKYDKDEFLGIIKNISKYKYICFTSTYAVDIFFEILLENNLDIRIFHDIKVASVGISTSEKLREKGIISEIIPDEYNTKSLAEKLINENADDILCILPNDIQSDLYDTLKENKKNTTILRIYEKHIGSVRIYNELKDDIYVFTSSSSVLGLVNSYEKNHFSYKLAFCIGEKTNKTALSYGFNTVVSKESTIQSLVDEIINKLWLYNKYGGDKR